MPRNQRRIDAVLFDLDDTLLSWHGVYQDFDRWIRFKRQRVDAVHDHLTADGHALPDRETFYETVDGIIQQSWETAHETHESVQLPVVLEDALERLGLELSRVDRQALLEAYGWAPIPGVEPFEDSVVVLEALRGRGYQIGLITNSIQPMWMRDVELAHHGLLDYFDARVTSGDVGYMKPHPDIYHQLLGELAVPPSRSVFVGDRPANDIAGANAVGMVSVLMRPVYLDPKHRPSEGVEADHVIEQLGELLTLLEELEQVRAATR